MTLVDVEGLTVAFGRGSRPVVRGLNLRVEPGECLALVGESGSGKSVTARSLLGLAGPSAVVDADRFRIGGHDVRGYGDRRWRSVRGRVAALVSQDAMVSLDPLRPVGAEIAEPLRLHGDRDRRARSARVVQLLTEVGVPDAQARAAQYPHQLSGGLRQRALIASALAAEPRLLIADEPTTALDVLVQDQVLGLLDRVRRDGLGLLLISHDLAVVARLADRVAVMRDGEIVESGPTERVLARPRHEYTRVLIAAAADGAADRAAPPATAAVLTVRGVSRTYRRASAPAVDDVSLTLRAGETLGVVGESGSGKSTLARIVLGLLSADRGCVELDGAPWSALGERARRARRGEIQFVHQNPLAAFDPRFTVRRLLGEALPGSRGAARAARVAELLGQVGLDAGLAGRRPHELSGGQRQRIAIARALAPGPRVLVCDEPVSALDVSVRAQILDLLADVQQRTGVALLFITHDLGVVRRITDRLLIMRAGRVVEQGSTSEVFGAPRHAYTRALLAAVPRLGSAAGEQGEQRLVDDGGHDAGRGERPVDRAAAQ